MSTHSTGGVGSGAHRRALPRLGHLCRLPLGTLHEERLDVTAEIEKVDWDFTIEAYDIGFEITHEAAGR